MSHPRALVAILLGTVTAGCAAPDTSPEPVQGETVALQVAQVVVDSGAALGTLSEPLRMTLGDHALMSGLNLRQRLELAISNTVVDAGCLTFSWSELTATVAFDQCQLPGTTAQLDGSLTVQVNTGDPALVVTLDELTLGAVEIDGSLTAYLQGTLSAPTLGVLGDVTLIRGDTTLVVSGLDLAADADGVTLSGSGTITSATLDADATVVGLHWVLGDCLPSSGTVSFTEGAVHGIITFLATTPATGEVRLRFPPLPGSTVQMFPSCS